MSPILENGRTSRGSFTDEHDHQMIVRPMPGDSIKDVVTAGSTITPFDDLIDDVKQILGPSSGLDSADVDVETLMDRIRQYDVSHEHEWNKYAFQEPSRGYTRNGVDDINHKANLLILVWNPGKGSMIHDHADAHCIVKMLKGTLEEVRYRFPSKECCSGEASQELQPTVITRFEAGDVSYMSDTLGTHRMVNPDPHNIAVSLHLYTPPYAAKFGCHIFDQRTGKSSKVDMSTLYSDRGVLCKTKSNSC